MTTVKELDTPVAVVDLDILHRNIHKLQSYLDKHGIINRPHIKTHKIPDIAKLQLGAGAPGVTCQKISEAMVMADAGITDLFIPYNLLGEPKLKRLASLMQRASVSVTVDSAVPLSGLSWAARRAEGLLPVLVEFDTGLGRCGVQTVSEAVELAQLISQTDGLHLGGLMTYPCNDQTDHFVREVRAELDHQGLQVERVSVGGTHCMWQAHLHPEVSEYRAGMYVYGDRATVRSGAMQLEDCSYGIISTVVSRPTATRGIVDAGSKSLASDLLGLDGHGLILEYPDARIYNLSEEHGHVDFSKSAKAPEIGERVTILPNHCCVSNNLFNQIVGVRNGKVEVVWPVKARGAVT